MNVEKYVLKKFDIIEKDENEFFNVIIMDDIAKKEYNILISIDYKKMLIKKDNEYVEHEDAELFNIADTYLNLLSRFILYSETNIFPTVLKNGYTLELVDKKISLFFDVDDLNRINDYMNKISSINITNDDMTVLFDDRKALNISNNGILTDVIENDNIIYKKILLSQILIATGYVLSKLYHAMLGEDAQK